MRILTLLIVIGLIQVIFLASGSAEPTASQQFGTQVTASIHSAYAYGQHAKGCLAGAVELPETGPTWQAMRLSRNRNWGHPQAIAFIRDLSESAATLSEWEGLYVGDISQPRGGPMLSAHRSHQIGLDIDFWFLPATSLGLSVKEREIISSISLRKDNGAFVNDNWSWSHHQILRTAARDARVARIFVFPGAKVQMCKDEIGNRDWLRKIRPWWGHHYHFHVRLTCPVSSHACVNQAPPPPGDGCADAQLWVDDILNPPEHVSSAEKLVVKPPVKLKLSDLPHQCTDILHSK
ncbi:MAG: penicillin-insensitive murein endopeptidase [Aestuariivita sp.]|nr:penicillin-insensitive murein endopeptidase [Aestuariivita sp.]